ncbi:MAG TPA: lipopolysaccharide assembly protein LapA domain-containing protein [Xanthobacteraceae bacterium]|nr:lipopolysaccharide assembly protein LapA domain-containing protein [Xanthobacteraceae bacterium]
MIRKTFIALVVVPLGILIAALAVVNRGPVTISLDPFSAAAPALSVTLPLYGLVLLVVVAGVVIGGAAAWLRQGKWRRSARRLDAEVRNLRAENDILKRRLGMKQDPRWSRPAGALPPASLNSPAA